LSLLIVLAVNKAKILLNNW